MTFKSSTSVKDRNAVRRLAGSLQPHEERIIFGVLDDLVNAEKEIARVAALPKPEDLTKELTAENMARAAEIELLKARLARIAPMPHVLQKAGHHDTCKTDLPKARKISVSQTATWKDDGILISTTIRREYYCDQCAAPVDVEDETRRMIDDPTIEQR